MIVTNKIIDTTVTVVKKDNQIKTQKLSQLKGKNGMVLFFYPKDFTFVCPSEIIAFDNKVSEFEKRGYTVVGCSVDNEYVHVAWRATPVEKGGIGQIKYDLISDIKRELAKNFDVLFDDSVALRGSFLIDNELVVRHAVVNDLPLGRNIDEMLRMVDALEFYKANGNVCPANWKKGKDGIKPSTEGISDYLKNKNEDLK